MTDIAQIIDLETYPLDRLDAAEGEAFVEECRRQLDLNGSCLLPGFLRTSAIESAVAEATAIADLGHQVNHLFAYDDVNDDSLHASREALPPDHPRNYQSLTYIRFIAKDLIPESSPLRTIHRWQPMADFLARVMQLQAVYPSDCPLSGCILTVAEEGELQDWHFDGNDFIVTLMLEAPKHGGAFEYVTGLRDPESGDDFENIAKVLNGGRESVNQPKIDVGTLTLFKGKYNLHRAAPVGPESRRIMGILSYEKTPGQTGTPDYLRLFYGRSLEDLTDGHEARSAVDVS